MWNKNVLSKTNFARENNFQKKIVLDVVSDFQCAKWAVSDKSMLILTQQYIHITINEYKLQDRSVEITMYAATVNRLNFLHFWNLSSSYSNLSFFLFSSTGFFFVCQSVTKSNCFTPHLNMDAGPKFTGRVW